MKRPVYDIRIQVFYLSKRMECGTIPLPLQYQEIYSPPFPDVKVN